MTSWCSTRAISGACTSAEATALDFNAVSTLAKAEEASDDSRLTYVAMTRAQSQVVAWWAPSKDEPNGGLSRLLRGRRPGEAAVPDRCSPEKISDDDAMALFHEWEAAGGPVIEESVVQSASLLPRDAAAGPTSLRGTSIARSTPRGDGPRTRV